AGRGRRHWPRRRAVADRRPRTIARWPRPASTGRGAAAVRGSRPPRLREAGRVRVSQRRPRAAPWPMSSSNQRARRRKAAWPSWRAGGRTWVSLRQLLAPVDGVDERAGRVLAQRVGRARGLDGDGEDRRPAGRFGEAPVLIAPLGPGDA